MDVDEIKRKLDEMFDCAMVDHGFVKYMRDYEIVVNWADEPTGASWHEVQYLFKYCVQANVSTRLGPEIWSRSLDETLVNPGDSERLSGFVWGVRWSELYPGAKLELNSGEAARWSDQVGIPFYEAIIETNAFAISLIFSDLSVSDPAPSLSPGRD